jgi:hypothetical protein
MPAPAATTAMPYRARVLRAEISAVDASRLNARDGTVSGGGMPMVAPLKSRRGG